MTDRLTQLINRCFEYVIITSEKYKIDESHALKHSMEVFRIAKQIYESEVLNNPFLEKQKEIIFISAIGHDMCDKKYMDEYKGISEYKEYLSDLVAYPELEIIGKIISTMSYSKVKKNGFPKLNEYQLAYHIIREADLLAAYDIDRCIIYSMYISNCNYIDSLPSVFDLFNDRVLKMRKNRLFKTTYSKKESLKLHKKAEKDIQSLKKLL
jgi:hypothetical protein